MLALVYYIEGKVFQATRSSCFTSHIFGISLLLFPPCRTATHPKRSSHSAKNSPPGTKLRNLAMQITPRDGDGLIEGYHLPITKVFWLPKYHP